MNSISCSRLWLVPVLFLTLTAGQCENKDARFVLERMPDHYRQCAERVVVIPDGPLTQKQLLALLVDLKKGYDGKDRCLKGAIAWSDAQVDAFNRYYGH